MASGPHTFAVIGVFSGEQFNGNRLAIVAVRGNSITPNQKRLIAKEFGYTSTVFIYDSVNPGAPRRIDIVTSTGEDVTFSGHSVLGVAHYIFEVCEPNRSQNRDQPLTTVLMTKGGPVPVLYNPLRQVAACSVPHNFHIHSQQVSFSRVIDVQPQLQIVPTVGKCQDMSFPIVSIVKGMSFALVDLTDAPELLPALRSGKSPATELDDEWKPSFIGTLYYVKKNVSLSDGEPAINSIQARMITQGFEDPGTGSACTALACYLAMTEDRNGSKTSTSTDTELEKITKVTSRVQIDDSAKPTTQKHVYAILQGVELGKNCTIAIEVDTRTGPAGAKSVKSVTLSGRARLFARGELCPM